MIKHIVMWTLKNIAGEERYLTANKVKDALESLNGKIPGLKLTEVGIDFSNKEAPYDIVLYSELEDKNALEVYRKHPEHLKVAEYVASVVDKRSSVDYEVKE